MQNGLLENILLYTGLVAAYVGGGLGVITIPTLYIFCVEKDDYFKKFCSRLKVVHYFATFCFITGFVLLVLSNL